MLLTLISWEKKDALMSHMAYMTKCHISNVYFNNDKEKLVPLYK